MKGISTAAAFLAISIVSSAVGSDIDCQGKPDGTAIRDPDDCSIWYSCVGNVAEMYACPADTLFETTRGFCLAPELVTSCENKPDSFHDPCPATNATITHIPYPSGNPANLAFYVICKNRKFKGYGRNIRNNGVVYSDQKYFKRCSELKGRVRVLFTEHPEYYFLCVDGIHTKTKKITPEVKDLIVRLEDVPKAEWKIAQENAAAAKAKAAQDEKDAAAAAAKLKKEQEDYDTAAASSAAAIARAKKDQDEAAAATTASIATANKDQDQKDAAKKVPKLLAAAAKAKSHVREKMGDFVVAARGVVEQNRRHNEGNEIDATTTGAEKDGQRKETKATRDTESATRPVESFTDAARGFEEVRNLRMVASGVSRGFGGEQKLPAEFYADEKKATQTKLIAQTKLAQRLVAEADEAKSAVKEKRDEFEEATRRLKEERRQRKEAFEADKGIKKRNLIDKLTAAQKLSTEAAETTRLAREKLEAAYLAPIGEERIRLLKEAKEENFKAGEADMAAKAAEVQVKSEIAAEFENLAKNKRDEYRAASRGFNSERILRKKAFEAERIAGEKELTAKNEEAEILSAKAAMARILANEKSDEFRAAAIGNIKDILRIEAEEEDRKANEAYLTAKTAKTQLYLATAEETKRLAKDKRAEFEAATHGFEEERRLLKEAFEQERKARVGKLEVQLRETRRLSADTLRLKNLAKEKRDAFYTAETKTEKDNLRIEADKAFAETRDALSRADAAAKQVRLAKTTETQMQAEENFKVFLEVKRIIGEERDLQKEVFDADRKVAEQDLESKAEEASILSAEAEGARELAKEKRNAFNAAAPGEEKNMLQREADEADQRASGVGVAAEIAEIQKLAAEAALAKSLAKEKRDIVEVGHRNFEEILRLLKELTEVNRKANEVDLIDKRTESLRLSAEVEVAKRVAKEKWKAFDAAAPGEEKDRLRKDAERADQIAGGAVVAAKAAETQKAAAEMAEEERLSMDKADSIAIAKRSIDEGRKLRKEADDAERHAVEMDIKATAANAQRLSTVAAGAKKIAKGKRDAFDAALPGEEKNMLQREADEADRRAGEADMAAKSAEAEAARRRLAREEIQRLSLSDVTRKTKENGDAIRIFDEKLIPSLYAVEKERNVKAKNFAAKSAERELIHAEAKKALELLEDQKNKLLRVPIGSQAQTELQEATINAEEIFERLRGADLAAKAAEREMLTAEAELAKSDFQRTKYALDRAIPGSEQQRRLSLETEEARKNARKAVDALVAYQVRSIDSSKIIL